MVTPSRVSCTSPDTLPATISRACSASRTRSRLTESRCGTAASAPIRSPSLEPGDVAQPVADSLELLVDVDSLAVPAEHGRQVRLALLLEPHQPLHEALDEVVGAADLAGGLLDLVVVLRHLLAQLAGAVAEHLLQVAHELVAEPLAVDCFSLRPTAWPQSQGCSAWTRPRPPASGSPPCAPCPSAGPGGSCRC